MMISSNALTQAANLCAINNQRFSAIGPRCFSYVDTVALLDQIESTEATGDLFLSLLQSELEDASDSQWERNQQVWAAA